MSAATSTVRRVELSDSLAELSREELSALCGAAAWYARYHASHVAAEASANHASAVSQRERYLALIDALRKLGMRIPLPDELAARGREPVGSSSAAVVLT